MFVVITVDYRGVLFSDNAYIKEDVNLSRFMTALQHCKETICIKNKFSVIHSENLSFNYDTFQNTKKN